jgi:hypothetical protein
MPILRVNDPNWADMSDYVVHFVKRPRGAAANITSSFGISLPADYEAIISILGNGMLEARNAFGIAATSAPNPNSQKVACFSEVPLHMLKRLVDRRGTSYGVGFTKQFIVDKGGGPIMYAYFGTPHEQAIRSMLKAAAADPSADIWKLTPLIDSAGASRGGGTPYLFEWEREWRHVGNFTFAPTDAAFLLIPEELHEAAAGFFADAEAENTGPAYKCPFIDPKWDISRIRAALS